MFETISGSRPRRPAAGSAVSIVLHTAVIGAAVWVTARQVKPREVVIEHIYQPGPKGDPKHNDTTAPRPHPPRKKKPRPELTRPTAVEPAPPAPVLPETVEAADDASEADDGVPGVPGGQIGSPDGTPGGTGLGPRAPQPFDEGTMTPPRRISGPDPVYTPQALEREIEGLMAVKCVVTEQGLVHGCRVLKSLPYMDAAVIQALERCRYTPARVGGRPVEVDYLFQLHLQLPSP